MVNKTINKLLECTGTEGGRKIAALGLSRLADMNWMIDVGQVWHWNKLTNACRKYLVDEDFPEGVEEAFAELLKGELTRERVIMVK
ncbi:hypothetical protein, partial [Escherichia coli]|uniref:hypothetical protein n=1 Tax=Escherichia coli TaxID=562 RepID=UPI0013B3E1C7